jgi:REP element-mobilizing transposase RayT
MSKVDYIDFQDRTEPLAYLITFRCYGTWLHGDNRGSVDRKKYRVYGTRSMPTNSKLAEDEKAELRHPPITLDSAQRDVVEKSIREVCDHRGYALHAVNVRTNHVHSVVTASCKPERVMDSFKAYATRRLREARLLGKDAKAWARHGSTPYLWTKEEIQRAIDYVVNGQGEESFANVDDRLRRESPLLTRGLPTPVKRV